MYVPVGYTQVLRPVILMNIESHRWWYETISILIKLAIDVMKKISCTYLPTKPLKHILHIRQ